MNCFGGGRELEESYNIKQQADLVPGQNTKNHPKLFSTPYQEFQEEQRSSESEMGMISLNNIASR